MIGIHTSTVNLQIGLDTLLVWIIVGLIAGFLASRTMLGHGMGMIGDIVVGIIGAFIGGFLASYFGIRVTITGVPLLGQIIIAFIGALLLLMVLRLFGVGRRRGRVLV
jgi:uncharacterized membrane protein YeaQ/YmgE (transglycosylase-associated protein family)